jgi:ribosomal-protein-alanine N-acetyltransferase
MKPPRSLRTRRLRLRPPVLKDAATIFKQYATDPKVTRFLTWQPHKSIVDTRAFLQRCAKVRKEGTHFPWVIVRSEDGKLIGMIEIGNDGHRVTVGYVLARPYWGNGYMTEATKAIVKWCFTQPNIHRVWAFTDVRNRASRCVLEKAGMEKEGILRRWMMHPNLGDRPRDCYCYSIVRR